MTRFKHFWHSPWLIGSHQLTPPINLHDLMFIKIMLSSQRHYLKSGISPKVYMCLQSTYCLLSTCCGLNTYCMPDPVWVGEGTVPPREPLVQEGMTLAIEEIRE